MEQNTNEFHDNQIDNEAPQKKASSKGIFFSVAFGVAVGFFGGAILVSYLSHTHKDLWSLLSRQAPSVTNSTIDTNSATTSLISEDAVLVDMVAKTSPAVVSVVISKDVPKMRNSFNNPFGTPFFFDPFGEQQQGQRNTGETEKQTIGQGSGFLVSSDGLIVTNRHVVSDTQADYTVIMNDKKEYKASVLARDPQKDIALLKIDGQDLPFLDLGDSDNIKVGQTVVAIGNSLGEFSNTVSKGIVSGLKRNLVAGSDRGEEERLSNIIQTDAAINPGNSGGPLLDISGKVIGVNVAVAQGAENIGFALPINQVQKIIRQVQATGKIASPFLGIRYIMLTPEIQKENNLPLDHGALVLRGEKMTDFAVIPGSPADKSGIMENDIILEIDGVEVDKTNQVADIIADYQPNDTITITLWHKGETKDVAVTLEDRKQQ